MSPLLGLLLLLCGRDCALPLPGHVLEVRAQDPAWRWCLRVDEDRTRVCLDEVPGRLDHWLQQQPVHRVWGLL
ncbi:MAG TPA: hypothetical protein VGC74_14165 [Stenotrophomonas sp.]|jgi:hypothetical protein